MPHTRTDLAQLELWAEPLGLVPSAFRVAPKDADEGAPDDKDDEDVDDADDDDEFDDDEDEGDEGEDENTEPA